MIESTVINKSIVENGWEISNSPIYAEIAWRISPVLQAAQATKRPLHFNAGSVMEVSPAWKPSQQLRFA